MEHECEELTHKTQHKCLTLLNKARRGKYDYMDFLAMEHMANVYLTMPQGSACKKALKYRVRLLNVHSEKVCQSLPLAWRAGCIERFQGKNKYTGYGAN